MRSTFLKLLILCERVQWKMKFKNQQEIWKHLVDGGKIKGVSSGEIICFVDGSLKNQDGCDCNKYYVNVYNWTPYQEPIELEFEAVVKGDKKEPGFWEYRLEIPMYEPQNILGKRFKVTMLEIVGEG